MQHDVKLRLETRLDNSPVSWDCDVTEQTQTK